MKSRRLLLVLPLAALIALTSCQVDADPNDPAAIASPGVTQPQDVSEHESGPESPLTYGMQVPQGATQLGPLIRFRSSRLIAAYQPELAAAEAQRDAEARDKAAEDQRQGTPPTPRIPTPDTRPSDDSFSVLDSPPKPDSTVSLMRIDGDPTDVVRRMLVQIDALLPDAGVVTDDLAEYCAARERRITSCRSATRGLTADDRDIRVTMTVDPGDLATRVSGPSDLTRPVMSITIEYLGEPRKGQLDRESSSLGDLDEVRPEDETSQLIWPKMDEDAPSTAPLLNGWIAPTVATILLSGQTPQFVILTTKRAVDGDLAAQQFVQSRNRNGKVTKDVVEDLNEVSTTYSTRTKAGSFARATYVLSARGNYTALFYFPAEK